MNDIASDATTYDTNLSDGIIQPLYENQIILRIHISAMIS